jgi:hypothetical protein
VCCKRYAYMRTHPGGFGGIPSQNAKFVWWNCVNLVELLKGVYSLGKAHCSFLPTLGNALACPL